MLEIKNNIVSTITFKFTIAHVSNWLKNYIKELELVVIGHLCHLKAVMRPTLIGKEKNPFILKVYFKDL